jgi:hypothetical protein
VIEPVLPVPTDPTDPLQTPHDGIQRALSFVTGDRLTSRPPDPVAVTIFLIR